MTVANPPDVIGNFIEFTRANPDVIALGAFVGTQRPGQAAGYAVVLQVLGGTRDDELGTGLPRLQVTCYGAGETEAIQQRTAMDLWRAVHNGYVPLRPQRGGFRSATIIVPVISTEMAPLATVDQQTDRPVVIGVYRPLVKAVVS